MPDRFRLTFCVQEPSSCGGVALLYYDAFVSDANSRFTNEMGIQDSSITLGHHTNWIASVLGVEKREKRKGDMFVSLWMDREKGFAGGGGGQERY